MRILNQLPRGESPRTSWVKTCSLFIAGTIHLFMDVTIPGEDPDELEVYGADTRSGPSLTSYRFEVALLALPLHCCKNYMYVRAPV